MAENEILDIKWGQSWKGTRRLLARPTATATELAVSVCDDSKHVVARNLKQALQKGTPLYLLLKASQGSPEELRAAVKVFPSGQLAKIAVAACLSSTTKDPAEVGRIAATMLVDKHIDIVGAQMLGSEGWRDEGRRRNALIALEHQREEWIDSIASNLERSLRGEPIKGTRRHAMGERVTASVLAARSLLPKREPLNDRKR